MNRATRRQTMKQTKERCVCGNRMTAGALACAACNEDLSYSIARRMSPNGNVLTIMGEITLKEFIESIRQHGIGDVGTCAICNGRYVLWGNNPRPVVTEDGARCCHRCNDEVVIPARMQEMELHFQTC